MDSPKRHHRAAFLDDLNASFSQVRLYDDEKYNGKFFDEIHNSINLLVTTETFQQMRGRLSQVIGREIEEQEFFEDYCPVMVLYRYIMLWRVTGNLMRIEGLAPLEALRKATEIFLPSYYIAKPIDFTNAKKEKTELDRAWDKDMDRIGLADGLEVSSRAFESHIERFL